MMLILAALLGLIIGSFLNVVIVRYPQMLMREWRTECLEFLKLPPEPSGPSFNLLWPRSHCPHCQHRLSLLHNIPVISFVWLRGRCAYCRQSISWQYPIVETITALATALVFAKFGWSYSTLGFWILSWGLIILAGIDWQIKILPDTITLSLLWLGLIFNLIFKWTPIELAIIGAILGYLVLWTLTAVFKLVRKKQGMGHGDFKMLAMFGAWLGVAPLINILLLAVLLSLFVNLILLALKKIRHDQPLPFGPYLAIGGWITVMINGHGLQEVIQWFLK